MITELADGIHVPLNPWKCEESSHSPRRKLEKSVKQNANNCQISWPKSMSTEETASQRGGSKKKQET